MAYFGRPGPRLADSLELPAHLLHPELVPESPWPFLPLPGQGAERRVPA